MDHVLVRGAAKRVIAAGDKIGIRGTVVHAISEEAKPFIWRLVSCNPNQRYDTHDPHRRFASCTVTA